MGFADGRIRGGVVEVEFARGDVQLNLLRKSTFRMQYVPETQILTMGLTFVFML